MEGKGNSVKDFDIIYRILNVLRWAMDFDEWDVERLSPQSLKTTERRRNALLCLLCDDGYITGLKRVAYVGDDCDEVTVSGGLRITLKGLEYLQENAMMRKIAKTVKGIKDVLPLC